MQFIVRGGGKEKEEKPYKKEEKPCENLQREELNIQGEIYKFELPTIIEISLPPPLTNQTLRNFAERNS